MRPGPVLLLAILSTATLLPFGERPAAASCAAPYLADSDHLVIQHGKSVKIAGAGFQDGCQDTGSCSGTLGCSRCDYGPAPTPMSDITLTLRQNGRTWLLGTADARGRNDDLGAVTWAVEIPTGVKSGWATLVPEHGEPAKIRVR